MLILHIKPLEEIDPKINWSADLFKKEKMKEVLPLLVKDSEDFKRKVSLIIKIDHQEMLIIKEESGSILEDIHKLLHNLTLLF